MCFWLIFKSVYILIYQYCIKWQIFAQHIMVESIHLIKMLSYNTNILATKRFFLVYIALHQPGFNF